MSDETPKKAKSVRDEATGIWSVVTRAPKVDREVTVNLNLHDGSVQEMVKWTSEKCVKDDCTNSWIISFQSNVRRMLEAGKTAEEIQAFADTYKPDVTVKVAQDPIAATLGKFQKMSAEEQQAFMKQLKERLAKKS
jgi:hypothetical protein